jgi:DNA-binding response OmpR family regulator
MTGYSESYGLIDVIRAGAGDYMTKPFTLNEIKAKKQARHQREGFASRANTRNCQATPFRKRLEPAEQDASGVGSAAKRGTLRSRCRPSNHSPAKRHRKERIGKLSYHSFFK